MRYSTNNPKGISEHEQRDADLVEDDMVSLLGIVRDARELVDKISRYRAATCDTVISHADIKEAAGGINDILSDLLGREYARLTDEGCPLHLPLKLPDVSVDNILAKAACNCDARQLTGGYFTNPATSSQKEEIERLAQNDALAGRIVSTLQAGGIPASRIDRSKEAV